MSSRQAGAGALALEHLSACYRALGWLLVLREDAPGAGGGGEASFALPMHLLPVRALPLRTQAVFFNRADPVTAWETG